MTNRNASMIARIEATPVRYPFRFAFLGDSFASDPPHNPLADVLYGELLKQVCQLDPTPLFFANLGDFAATGTPDRHERYLDLVAGLAVPNICLIGNHDRDNPIGWEMFRSLHGPVDFQFAYGHTRFIAINAHSGTQGPREEDLAFLEAALREDDHPHQIVLMHMPPHLAGHYAPHPEWGFTKLEAEFLALLKAHRVRLVCCAHVLGYDFHVHDNIPFVVSGGGGWGLCSHYGAYSSAGFGTPPFRGSFYHFVEVTVHESGAITGRVIKALAGTSEDPNYSFAIEVRS